MINIIKIIETNISYNNNNEILDHQARVITYKSWEDYIDDIKNMRSISCKGTMMGNILPKNGIVDKLKYDDFHLYCDVVILNKSISKKFAYLVNGEII